MKENGQGEWVYNLSCVCLVFEFEIIIFFKIILDKLSPHLLYFIMN